MSEQPETYDEGGFAAFLTVLRRRAWLVLLCLIVVPAAALAYTERQTELYTADAEVLLQTPGFEESIASPVDGPESGDADTLPTDVGVASLGTLADRAQASLRARGVDVDVRDKVDVSTDGEANVISIAATDPNPALAARIANAYARQYIAFRRAESRRRIRDARRTLRERLSVEGRERRRQAARLTTARARILRRMALLGPESAAGPRGSVLEDRADELRERVVALREQDDEQRQRVTSLVTLENLQTGNARLVESATAPTEPSSPQPMRNLAAGIALGLLLGVLLAVLFEVLDRRLRNPKEIGDLFQSPIVGGIPYSPELMDGSGSAMRPPPTDREAYRLVHANVRYTADDRDIRSILVTSGTPGDGKTTVAWNVAVSAAETGTKVLFIETDLRHPTVAERLKAGRREGLVDVLRGWRTPAQVICQIPIADGFAPGSGNGYAYVHENGNGNGNGNGHHNGNGNGHGHRGDVPVPTMDVLFAGRTLADPRGLLASATMRKVLRYAEQEYELVIIDTPPAAVIADAVPLMRHVSGVLVVVRLGGDSREAAQLLSDQLRNLKANVLGVVINAVEPQDAPYGAVSGYAREYAVAD